MKDYFITKYPDIDFSVKLSISTEAKKEVEKINMMYEFPKKMKYLYSLTVSKDIIREILINISDPTYAKYYYTISKERASALKFQKGNLEKEYKSIKAIGSNRDNIIDEIKSRFKVGKRYSKVFIKETLRSIYETNGWNKTPKAVDLENYFELKPGKVLNSETNKRDAGFEIVSIKDEKIGLKK